MGRFLKHPSSQLLYGHWNERRGARAAPERADIEPGAIRTGLGDSFILGCNMAPVPVFRLAGTRVCGLFGRELKGVVFEQLWNEGDRPAIRDLVASVGDEMAGLVAGANATTSEGDAIRLELLMLPLRHRGNSQQRQIGVLAPVGAPSWSGFIPLETLTLESHRHIGAGLTLAPATPFMAAVERARLRGLRVFHGGRT